MFMIELGECERLRARISEKQCKTNKLRGVYACGGCLGLGDVRVFDETSLLLQVNKPVEVKGGDMANRKCDVGGCDKYQVRHRRCVKHAKEYEKNLNAKTTLESMFPAQPLPDMAIKSSLEQADGLDGVQQCQPPREYGDISRIIELALDEVFADIKTALLADIELLSPARALCLAARRVESIRALA
jgi:hypothetical protein